MRHNNTQCASTQAIKHTTTAAAHRESGCSTMQAHCSRSCPAAHSESLQPSAAFRGLPRPSAAFHGAHCMPVPWAFRAFRASRHVPRIPRSTRHDATRGIRGWLPRKPEFYPRLTPPYIRALQSAPFRAPNQHGKARKSAD